MGVAKAFPWQPFLFSTCDIPSYLPASGETTKPEETMYHIDSPEGMSEEERFKEIAAILAAGYLRLKKRFPHPVPNASQLEKPPLLTEKGLDSSVNKSPHVYEVN